MKKFSSEIIKKIKFYVYLISDPETGEVFYVGKGKGNRVFSHFEDRTDNAKTRKIAELKKKNIQPKIEILVHGVDDEVTIKKIEAAIIDLIGKNKLTNKVGGYESSDYGRMDLSQITAKYSSKPAKIIENVMLIKLSDTFRYNMDPMELYDYTRGIWILSQRRDKADYAFAVYDGVIQETYKIVSWFKSGSTYSTRITAESWKRHSDQRWEFVGDISESMQAKYKYKSVESYYPPGARNPIRYVNCKS